jgi:hypothetical protein
MYWVLAMGAGVFVSVLLAEGLLRVANIYYPVFDAYGDLRAAGAAGGHVLESARQRPRRVARSARRKRRGAELRHRELRRPWLTRGGKLG